MSTWYDNGMPVIDDPDVLATAELIRRLYAMPGCDMGGRLHVVLDDGNYEDDQISSSYYQVAEGRTIETYLCESRFVPGVGWRYDDELCCTPEEADLCRLILASFRRMPEPWRAASIAWFDGTIARYARALAARSSTTQTATSEQVGLFITELRQEIERGNTPPEPKPCTPVPCPPFKTVPQGIHDAWAIAHPGPAVDAPVQVVGANETYPEFLEQANAADRWQQDAWAKMPQVLSKLMIDGEVRFTRTVEPSFTTDVEQILLEEQNKPPKVLYRGALMGPGLQGRIEAWLADPKWDRDTAPLIVGMPSGVDAPRLIDAITLCQQAGLLPATPHGILCLPADLEG